MSLRSLLQYGFSAFLVSSPLTSYLDTVLSINRNKSAGGFSIDVCGIMLVASLMRINFWIGDRFDTTLLIQSFVMIGVQSALLHQCLKYPSISTFNKVQSQRPFKLWQWSDKRMFWRFLAQFTLTLAVLQLVFGTLPQYVALLGTIGLGIEATLPIPQFLNNNRTRSVDGVRLSMIASWVFGDMCKLIWFYYGSNAISIQFKLCAFVQTFFDASIALQYYLWHKGSIKDELPGRGVVDSQELGMLPT